MEPTKTPGAFKAGRGRHVFDLARLPGIDAGAGYSTAHGPVVEGERIQVALVRMPKGTGARPHSHPNEQWIYVLQGTLECEVAGVRSVATPGMAVYIPASVVHAARATPDEDVVFFTAKDTSHGIVGTAADAPGRRPRG